MSVNLDPKSSYSPEAGRIVERTSLGDESINQILSKLNLTLLGEDVTIPEGGRIASSLIVNTREKGEVMLRFYPLSCADTKLESGNIDFEVSALDHLAKAGMPVPAPLQFTGGQLVVVENGIAIFAYQLLPGNPLEQKDLSLELATTCGKLLQQMRVASKEYHPPANPPTGDLQFLERIYNTLTQKYPELQGNPHLTAMLELLKTEGLADRLEQTPRGIVHADFFAENIVYDEASGKYSIIDFGDAYYGHTIMDLVIGSMEFCVLEDDSWSLPLFTAFIKTNETWLKENKISFDFFHDLLLVNCVRFAIYTLPGDLESHQSVENNPYIRRFEQLKDESFTKNLREVYEAAIE
ncbi:MAG: Homoserine kinase [Chlamydiales bacterium]|nr:Homoserine kinase [Chlamydiales bacterium]